MKRRRFIKGFLAAPAIIVAAVNVAPLAVAKESKADSYAWDMEAILKDFNRVGCGWTAEDVERNVLQKYEQKPFVHEPAGFREIPFE